VGDVSGFRPDDPGFVSSGYLATVDTKQFTKLDEARRDIILFACEG
jgi:hypothetical protein